MKTIEKILIVSIFGLGTLVPFASAKSVSGTEIPFIRNDGQLHDDVAYLARTFGGSFFVTRKGELVLSLPAGSGDMPLRVIIRETVGGTWIPEVSGSGRTVTRVSHFKGSSSQSPAKQAPTYRRVTLGEVLENIELDLVARANSVEKIFCLGPGADPASIRLVVEGTEGLSINDGGQLVLHTQVGSLYFSAPIAYQDIDGETRKVDVAYRLMDDGYGFETGTYDRDRELIIDPLLQATYLGGTQNELDPSIAVHPTSGDVYLTGASSSTDFPGTAMGVQPEYAGGAQDAFVARLSADLSTLVQATYLGGLSGDNSDVIAGRAIAFHPLDGSVYVAGHTGSSDFPGTAGGAQPGHAGQSDFFVARLSADLTSLNQATFLGGEGNDSGFALAVNSITGHPHFGQVYVLGQCGISGGFPGTAGGAQETFGGGGWNDTIVARLNADLTVFEQATYLGSDQDDVGHDLVVHPASGDVCVSGNTYSADFPGTTGGAQAVFGGTRDAFVTCLNPDLTAIVQSTYLGGTGVDYGSSISVDPVSGDLYVAGQTYSSDLPGTTGGLQPEKNNSDTSYDTFVARFDITLTTLKQATYLGSSADEYANTIAIHPVSGQIYVSGETYANDFPGTAGGADSTFSWRPDVYAARLSADLTTLHQSTYFGGNEADSNNGLAIHPLTGEVYVAGITTSTDLQGVAGGAQTTLSGEREVFVARFDISLAALAAQADIQVTPVAHDYGEIVVGEASTPLEVMIANTGAEALNVSDLHLSDSTHFSLHTDAGSSPCAGTSPVIAPATGCSLSVIFQPASQGALAAGLTVSSDDPDEASVTIELSGTGAPAVVTGDPDVNVTPAVHAFGDVEVGQSSAGLVVTIANTGSEALSVSGIELSDATQFTIDLNAGDSPCGGTQPVVAPGQDCTLTLAFQPGTQGAHSASLSISSDDPDEAQVSVDLSGTGVDPADDGKGNSGCGCAQPPGSTDGSVPAGIVGIVLLGMFHRRRIGD